MEIILVGSWKFSIFTPSKENQHYKYNRTDMTNSTNNNYCVILAGGKGRRLWPCSRNAKPKQFVDFFGTGRTQLQQTFDRMAKVVPADHIYINTSEDYVELVREQLPNVNSDHIMVEPIHRNTAPSTAWACHRISRQNPDARIVTTPSDQAVFNEEAFCKNVQDGLDFVASHDGCLTMGVKPTRPEPGYGYIQMGDPVDGFFYKVQSFTEKPDRDFARMFMESGEFYWNTGLFLANAKYLGKCFSELLPTVLRDFDEKYPVFDIATEDVYMKENFPSYPNISIDLGILEKTRNVYVMKCDFGWADLGTWHGIYEGMKRSENDNVVIDSDVMMEDCHNNIIKMPKGKLAVLNGLDGFIVAEKDNVLLVCRKEDSSALIRKYVNEVQIKKGEEYI